MELTKNRYYPTGMPVTDIKKRVAEDVYSTYYTMVYTNDYLMVCAINDMKPKRDHSEGQMATR
ncbi:hypothetical protein MBANPS3_012586 [Mucor bainieri]